MRFQLSNKRALGYATRGAGPVMAFLHPVGLRGAFWDEVVSELEFSFRLIAIDLPGHGESDVPHAPFSLDDMARDVVELLSVLAQEPCILVGCSMGGMVAQGVVLQAPAALRGLVLSNTSHQRPPEANEALRKRAAKARIGMPAVHDDTIERWFSPEFRARRPDAVARASRWLLDGDPVVHAWGWEAMANLTYGERLAGVAVPALVLAGSDDRSVSAAASDALTKVFPSARQHVFKAGHLPPLEVAAEYAQVLRDFANGLQT